MTIDGTIAGATDGGRPTTRGGASRGAPDWRFLLGRMHLQVTCGDPAEALELVAEVGRLGLALGRMPDVDLRSPVVHLIVGDPAVGAVTDADLRLCRAVGDLVARWGLVPEHPALTVLEVAVDVLDASAVVGFWRAVTGYVDDGPMALRDPRRVGASIWFQQMDVPRRQRNRIHLDVTVAHDEAPARLAAALAAGGVLVSDAAAPRFWVLADVEGNEACLCTWQGRDELEAAAAVAS